MACIRIPKAALWAALCLGAHTSAQPAPTTSNANPLCDLGSWDANRLEMCTQWEQAGHGCSTQWFQVCSAEHPWGNNVTLDQGCPERCLQSGEGPAANPTAALFTLPTSTGGFGAYTTVHSGSTLAMRPTVSPGRVLPQDATQHTRGASGRSITFRWSARILPVAAADWVCACGVSRERVMMLCRLSRLVA